MGISSEGVNLGHWLHNYYKENLGMEDYSYTELRIFSIKIDEGVQTSHGGWKMSKEPNQTFRLIKYW